MKMSSIIEQNKYDMSNGNKLSPFIVFILSLLVLASSSYANAEDDKFDNVIAAKVSKLKIRGASIAYFDSTKGMIEPIIRGYGKVSSSSSATKVTADTTFMLASVSKPFTASAVAVLVEKEIINSIDDDICNVIPSSEYDVIGMCRNPNYPDKVITWRMLITHRSSMKGNIPDARDKQGNYISPSYGPKDGYTADAPAVGNPKCPLDNVIDFYRTILTNNDPDDNNTNPTNVGAGVILKGGKELNWYDLAQSKGGMWNKNIEPGSKNVYSNAAVGFIPALIEFALAKKSANIEKTGQTQTFSEFCHQHLFQPLDMTTTAWFRKDLPDGTLEAVPVEYNKKEKTWTDVDHYCFIDYASGELRMSANDISKWSHAMMDGYGSSSTQTSLWSEEIGKQIVQCQEQDSNGKFISKKECDFGYGWILLNNSMKNKYSTDSWLKQGFAGANYDWTNGIWHDGAEAGSQTNLLILPNAGVYVAVLTNTDYNSETAAQQLTKTIVQAPLPSSSVPPISPTTAPPVLSPTPAPQLEPQQNPNSGNCPNVNEVEFVFKLTTDKFPKETKWKLKRNNKRIIKKVGYNTYKKKYTYYEESICIPNTGKYLFKIEDKYGDGLSKGNAGSYEIFVDSVLKKKGGDFKIKEITTWTI